MHQNTISNKIYFKGIGLHTGLDVNLELHPAKENSGITFFRKDLNKKIEASWKNVISTKFSTNLGVDNCFIKTVEHLLSAFAGLHISNCDVFIDNEEVPIMDGSSKVFVDLINDIGVKTQFVQKKVIKIMREVAVYDGKSSITASPSDEFSIEYLIDFEDPAIGIQKKKITSLENNFDTEISAARTFGMLKEVQYMHKNGLALGGSIDNAIVVDNGKILNPEGLRYKDEFVRHKILDLCGDIYLSGRHFIGNISAKCAGHEINNKFLWKFFSDKNNYQEIELNNIIPMEKATSAVA